MTITRSIILGLLVLQFMIVTSAHADPTCLIGKWQVQTESIAPSTLRGEWSVSGGLTIDVDGLGTARHTAARLTYDNYVLLKSMSRGGFDTMLEVRYDGVSEGTLSSGDHPGTISFRNGNKVQTVMRQKIGDRSWVEVDEDEETPPHQVHDITFECAGDELILTKSEEGPFSGAYRGLFERLN